MNKDKVLEFLRKYLGEYRCFDLLIAELCDLMAKSGNEPEVFRLLVLRLKQLSTLGHNATNMEEFENIGRGIYSMHLSGKGYNIRILYGFLTNNMPCLLLAFYERGGKRKTDYTSYLDPAAMRLSKMKEDFENEQYKI